MVGRLFNKIRGKFQLRRVLASQLGQNILTNYLAVVWMGGLSIALIPFYLKRLGPDQWGVVAICMAIQGFLGLLDAGLGQIMPRDIARVAGDRNAEARVFRVFSRAYFGLGLIGLVLGQASVPWLIAHWFNQGQGVGDGADLALRLVLVQFLFQFANNAHTGYWNGMQAQKLANFRQCFFGTVKHASALALVYLWRADALAYLLPFALVSALEWWANRRTVRRELGALVDEKVVISDFRILVREAGVLALGVLVGMLVTQMDRIILSRSVSVASFGHYIIISNLGLAFSQLQYPLMRAFYPKISRAFKDKENVHIKNIGLYMAIACVLPCLIAAIMAPWLLSIWLGDSRIVEETLVPLRLILGAVAINSIYQLFYQQLLASGHFRIVIQINMFALVVVYLQLSFLAKELGIVAGGIAWLSLALIQLCFGYIWHLRQKK